MEIIPMAQRTRSRDAMPEVPVSIAGMRRVLRAAGKGQPVTRKRLVLLWDGTGHDWLEGRRSWVCMLAGGDAAGEIVPAGHLVVGRRPRPAKKSPRSRTTS